MTADPENPKSKPGVLNRVLENLQLAKSSMRRPGDITISTVIEEWNIAEIERILDFCGEQGFVFATQTALREKMPNLRLKQNPRYQALVEKIIERRREKQAAHQRHSQTVAYRAGVWRLQVLSHHVPPRLSQW